MKPASLQNAAERLRERAREGPSDERFREAYEAVGAQVAEQRASLRLSQRELGDLCATTQSAVARLEAGRRAPRLDTLLRVAHALDCQLVVELRPRTKRTGRAQWLRTST